MAHWGSLEVLRSTLGDPGTSLRGPCDAPGVPTGSLLPPRGVPGARLGASWDFWRAPVRYGGAEMPPGRSQTTLQDPSEAFLGHPERP